MNSDKRDWPRLATTGVAAAQGLAMLGYGIGIVIIGLTSGLEGPEAVSSPTGATIEVVTFALLGAGLLGIAIGRWGRLWWSATPFVLAQLLALAVGIPLVTAAGSSGRTIGILITGSAIFGLVAMLIGALTGPDETDGPEAVGPRSPHTEV